MSAPLYAMLSMLLFVAIISSALVSATPAPVTSPALPPVTLSIPGVGWSRAVSAKVYEGTNNRKPSNSVGGIKTEHGDRIDCIDLYKQRAFDHPLLKNQKIQERPSHLPNGRLETSPEHQAKELEHLGFRQVCPDGTIPERPSHLPNGRLETSPEHQAKELEHLGFRQVCPDGTIPVRRNTNGASVRVEPEALILPGSGETLPGDNQPGTHFADLTVTRKTNFLEARGWIDVSNPKCGSGESSGAHMWISDGVNQQRNLITVGWTVNPAVYGDDRTHFSTYWAGDGYKTGCYDLRCSGFVQVDKTVVLGGVLPLISVPGGQRYAIIVEVYQDQNTKNWWLHFTEFNIAVGYWPKEIFSQFNNGATRLGYGGHVVGLQGQPTPAMGSGLKPNEESTAEYVGYFSRMQYTDGVANISFSPTAEDTSIYVDCPTSYDLVLHQYQEQEGSNFLYGGPGGKCP